MIDLTIFYLFFLTLERDPAAHVEQYKKLDLYKVNLESRQPEFVQTSWEGTETAHEMFNVKEQLKEGTAESNVAYFYKYVLI